MPKLNFTFFTPKYDNFDITLLFYIFISKHCIFQLQFNFNISFQKWRICSIQLNYSFSEFKWINFETTWLYRKIRLEVHQLDSVLFISSEHGQTWTWTKANEHEQRWKNINNERNDNLQQRQCRCDIVEHKHTIK